VMSGATFAQSAATRRASWVDSDTFDIEQKAVRNRRCVRKRLRRCENVSVLVIDRLNRPSAN
jgi:hypothetical protein